MPTSLANRKIFTSEFAGLASYFMGVPLISLIKKHRRLVTLLAITAIIGAIFIVWSNVRGPDVRNFDEVESEVLSESSRILGLISDSDDASVSFENFSRRGEECRTPSLSSSNHFYIYDRYDAQVDEGSISEVFESLNKIFTKDKYVVEAEESEPEFFQRLQEYDSNFDPGERESFSLDYSHVDQDFSITIYYGGGSDSTISMTMHSGCYKRDDLRKFSLA